MLILEYYTLMKSLATNRKATFDYEILEKYEAGLILFGYEVKAIKAGKMSLSGSYVVIKNNEAYLLNSGVAPYQPNNTPNGYDATRSRKMLLHKDEIKSLIGKTHQKGLTLIPLSVYTNTHGIIKIQFGLARGKKKYDKRDDIAKRDDKRRMQRAMRGKM